MFEYWQESLAIYSELEGSQQVPQCPPGTSAVQSQIRYWAVSPVEAHPPGHTAAAGGDASLTLKAGLVDQTQ